MKKKDERIILEDLNNSFFYKKKQSHLEINFNRIASIFFLFFFISK